MAEQKKLTKSIPLTGSITDNADDYLLAPPGMRQIINAHFDKEDSAVKTLPVKDASDAGVTNYGVSTPQALFAKDNLVATVGRHQLALNKSFGAAGAWTQEPIYSECLGMEHVLSTAEQSGGMNFSSAPIGYYDGNTFLVLGYCVAFERAQDIAGGGSKHIVIQIYDLQGHLTTESKYANQCQPIVQPGNNKATVVSVSYNTGTINTYSVTTSTISVGATSAKNVWCRNSLYNQTNSGYGTPGAEQNWEEMRLGYSSFANEGNGQLHYYNRPWLSKGILLFKDTTGTGTLRWTMTDTSGVPTGTTYTVYADVAPWYGIPLACATDGAANAYILWGLNTVASATPSSTVTFQRTTLTNTGLVASNFGPYAAVPINGTVATNLLNFTYLPAIAYTLSQGPVTSGMPTSGTVGQHRVRWIKFDTDFTTITDSGYIYSHRLVSQGEMDKDDNLHFCVQQWGNYNPANRTLGGAPNVPALTLAHAKPVSTLHILTKNADDSEENKVIAVYDAGQSKHMPAAYEEQNTHLMNLMYFKGNAGNAAYHQFWFGNRNVLTNDDNFYYISNGTPNPFTDAYNQNNARFPLSLGSSRLNMYYVRAATDSYQLTLEEGMAMGFAVPMWFDGSGLVSEMSPFDSPEIVGVRDTSGGDGVSYTAYQDLLVGGEEPVVFQVVYGFYDDAGLIHRSAPSTPVYVGKLQKGTTTTTAIELSVTPPLSLLRGGKTYFVEAYMGAPGEDLQLANVSQASTSDASTSLSINAITGGAPYGTGVGMYSYLSSKYVYSSGDVLAADPWPSFDFIVASGRRVFARSLASRGDIYYSKIFESGVCPEFSASLVVSLGDVEITAMGTLDDKLVAFTKDSAYSVYGSGPDNTGSNGDFFVEKLNFTIGCTDQDSVVNTDNGLAFYSSTDKRFYLLGRDLVLSPIGENVLDLTNYSTFDVKCSQRVASQHEIRWYVNAAGAKIGEYPITGVSAPAQPVRSYTQNTLPGQYVCFVYNYRYNKWTVLEDGTKYAAEVCAQVSELPVWLSSDWSFFRTLDDTTWYNSTLMKWVTPWININNPQDLGRIERISLLGRYLSSWTNVDAMGVQSGDLQVTVRYDYEGPDGATDVHRWRANQHFNPANGQRFQLELRPERAKCQALRLEIEEVATEAIEVWEPTYTRGRGIQLVSADVEFTPLMGTGTRTLSVERTK